MGTRNRRSAAEDPRQRVRRMVRTLLERVQRSGDREAHARVKQLRDALVKKRGGDPDKVAALRLSEIDKIERAHNEKYARNTQYELLIIVLSRDVSVGLRVQAGVMLLAEGDRTQIAIVHKAYPGLMPAIVKALKT